MTQRIPSRLLRWLCTVTLLAALAPSGAGALSYLSIQAGKMVLGNPGDEGDVSPILTTAGAMIPIIEVGPFVFEVSALVWGTRYEWVDTLLRAVPTQLETANQVWVLGLWAAPRFGLYFPLAKGRFLLGVSAGLAFNFRIPVFITDVEGEEARAIVGNVAEYFYAKSRFLFPESAFSFRWNISERFGLTFTLGTLYPLFHAWDGEGLPFADQLFVTALVGFSLLLPQRPRAPAAGQDSGAGQVSGAGTTSDAAGGGVPSQPSVAGDGAEAGPATAQPGQTGGTSAGEGGGQ